MDKLKLIEVDYDNMNLAIELQTEIFPNEKSPEQIKTGIKEGVPKNYIALINNTAVGIVGYYFIEEYPDCVFLNWFGVLPNFRCKGYGAKILNSFIEQCKNLPHKYLIAYTGKEENKVAIEFYKKMGFEVRDYNNQQDIKELKNIGIKNDFVVICKKLKTKDPIEFECIDYKIAKNIRILKQLNKN